MHKNERPAGAENHRHEGAKVKVGIVGARGYSGNELARLLLRHPGAELAVCFAGEKDFSLADFLPEARNVPVLPTSELGNAKLDTFFLATPAEVSMELAAKAAGNVIDLSGAFRLSAAEYKQWYGHEHTQKELIPTATYGLSPFLAPAASSKRLIANPGCYATSVLMALVPLLKTNLLEIDSLVIDAKSGATGAGRKAAENLLFTEVDGECLPYRVGKHQHLPEIRRWAEEISGVAIDPFFTTSLLPIRRGIIAGIYARLKSGKSAKDVAAAFTDAYRSYPLVRISAPEFDFAAQGISPKLALSMKSVVGTARTHLQFQVVGDKLYLFSLIDNLLKGAASQALENFNRLYDFPVGFSLADMEGTL